LRNHNADASSPELLHDPTVVTGHAKENTVLGLMNQWFEAARFGADVQRVIALRMMRLASGDTHAATEAQRMILEKASAFGEAQFAAMMALARGATIQTAAARAATPYRKRVRANRRRLAAHKR
jgi:hypothetical protein